MNGKYVPTMLTTLFQTTCNLHKMEVILDKEKLSSCESPGLGLLISIKQSTEEDDSPSTLVVTGQCACIQTERPVSDLDKLGLPTPSWVKTVEFAVSHFPGGCVPIGVWLKVGSETVKSERIWKILCSKTNLLEVMSPLILVTVLNDITVPVCYTVDPQTHCLRTEPVQIVSSSVREYLEENTVLCRLLTSVPLYVPRDQSVTSAMSSVETYIKDPSTVFYISSSKQPTAFSESTPKNTAALKTILPKRTKSNSSLKLHTQARNIAHGQTVPIPIELLNHHSQAAQLPSLLISDTLHNVCLKMRVPIDMLVIAHSGSTLRDLAATLRERMCSHLKAVVQSMEWKEGGVCSTNVHHIAVRSQHCPVTVLYPHTLNWWEGPKKTTPITTDDLRPLREDLHRMLCLGDNLPYLRVPRQMASKPGSHWLSSNTVLCGGPQLLNPHLQLKQPATDGSLATVQGDYLYYHYMQHGFNDDGWGCAYRSLQTVWSWYTLQGYTLKAPPTHRQIQESLVAAKDKQTSLIGSKEWIGSNEVSICLDQLLQVSCKINTCHHGSDMASKGRLLLEHFRTHGTPVMIGGGVLAHTILGVSFNELTGETLFLVLDPHYTGREDIKTITDKGKWCGWKQVSFWDKDALYNMCLPLRPENVI